MPRRINQGELSMSCKRHPAFLFLLLSLLILGATPAGAQDSAPPAAAPTPTPTGYTPPADSRPLADDVTPRPMLAAMRAVGETVPATWIKRTSRELGQSMIPQLFGKLQRKETIAQLASDFREGYVQVFVEMPGFMQMTVVEMATPEAAASFLTVNMDTLQQQLDATDQVEDATVEIISEEKLGLDTVEQAFEQRYRLVLGDMTTNFLTFFAQNDKHMFSMTFTQMEIDTAQAHQVLQALVAAMGGDGAGEAAAPPAGG